MKWIQIFKTGTHTASDGTVRDYTDKDLQRAVDNNKNPISIQIGHEKPNYEIGQITQLMRRGGVLMGLLSNDNIDKFQSLIKQGMNRISSGFSDVENMILDHVALLGATPMPAIKDLKAIKFEENKQIIKYEFSTNEGNLFMADAVFTEEIFNKQTDTIVDKIKGLFSKNETPSVKSEIDVTQIIKKEIENVTANFNSQMEALKKENTELKNSLGNSFSESRLTNFERYLDSDELKSKVTPAIKSRAMRLFNSLDVSGELNYTENDKEIKSNPVNEFKEILKLIPNQVTYEEFAVGGINTLNNSLAEQSKMIENFNEKGSV